MDALQPLAAVRPSAWAARIDSVTSRLPEDSSNYRDHWDSPDRAYIPAVRIKLPAPTTSDAFNVSPDLPAAAPTIRRRTLTLGAAVRGKPSRGRPSTPASKPFGADLGDEFADVLFEVRPGIPLQI